MRSCRDFVPTNGGLIPSWLEEPTSVHSTGQKLLEVITTSSRGLSNSAHDTGVVSEGEREIARRNWWCNFRPATARIKPSERHIGRPKPAICEASVSAATMTDILESSYRRTQSQPIGGSTWRLPERICVRCCVQHQAHNLLNRAAGNRLLVAIG